MRLRAAACGGDVRSTHENWDGTGYPDGLSGAAIPRAARIIAACGAYSAITSDRPYRAARAPRRGDRRALPVLADENEPAASLVEA